MANSETKILVIDDDPDIGVMLKLILEYNGYGAIVAETAEKAEEVIATDKVDLMVMDMLLSGANGTDLCYAFRRDPRTKNTPILMISAHPNAKELCLQAGADDFILKPFDISEILAKLKQLLQKAA